MNKKYAVFLGRWQPMHLGHEWLVRKKLDQGVPCLILIRNTPVDEKNPYTAEETKSMIEAAFAGEEVLAQIVPDVESINWGRGVGYDPIEHIPPENIKRISATEIRKRMKENDESWRDFVNPKVAKWLEEYYS